MSLTKITETKDVEEKEEKPLWEQWYNLPYLSYLSIKVFLLTLTLTDGQRKIRSLTKMWAHGRRQGWKAVLKPNCGR